MSVDTLFISVPFTDTVAPLMAPAIMKSIATKAGMTSAALDLNIETRNKILSSDNKDAIIDFLKNGYMADSAASEIFDIMNYMLTRIVSYSPRIVGISVFTYDCMWATKYLCYMIKKYDPSIKIVLGGSGLFYNLNSSDTDAKSLLENNFIDLFIKGDGEKTLFDYLSNNIIQDGGNSITWTQMTNKDLSELPIPNYDDYNFTFYERKVLPVLGSRGCVRNCDFCDIHVHWKKFTYRTGQSIFDEMIELSTKHGIYDFKFGDSLINGNQKEYKALMQLIAKHNESSENKITWSSFFIFRPKTQMSEEDWRLTALGGGQHLLVGIESLDDDVRSKLGKKFTNDDIEFGLQMAKKYGIKFIFLFLIGHIYENQHHIDSAIEWWKAHDEYKDTIELVNLGTPLGILDGTYLHQNFDKLNLRWVGRTQQDWANENSDPQIRLRWYKDLSSTIKEVGFTEVHPFDNHFIMERMGKNGSILTS